MLDTEILLTIKLHRQLFVDPKRIRLLKEIERCGSINQAAKNAKVSYKSAWDHLQAMDEISPKPILQRNTGGKHGGGTKLTTYAKRLLQLYDFLEQTQEKAFSILHDENIPLDNVLSATARISLQTSARNQFLGKVTSLELFDTKCMVGMEVEGFDGTVYAEITQKSAVRLQLVLGKDVIMLAKAPWVKILRTLEKNELMQKNLVKGTVTEVTRKNQNEEIIVNVDNHLDICASTTAAEQIQEGEQVWVHIEPEQIVLVTSR